MLDMKYSTIDSGVEPKSVALIADQRCIHLRGPVFMLLHAIVEL